MSAPVKIEQPMDEIVTLMGHLPEPEMAARKRLRDARTMASFRATRAPGPTARMLYWEASSWANDYVFAPADVEILDQVVELCRRLLRAALTAEELEVSDGVAD